MVITYQWPSWELSPRVVEVIVTTRVLLLKPGPLPRTVANTNCELAHVAHETLSSLTTKPPIGRRPTCALLQHWCPLARLYLTEGI